MTMTDTRIPIESDTRDRLRAEKTGGESYTDTINRVLDTLEAVEELPDEWRAEEGLTGNDCAYRLEVELSEEAEP